MGGYACLIEQDRFFRIDPGSNQRRDHFATVGRQFNRIIVDGDGVKIGQEKQALALILHLHPVLDRAQIIAEMEISRWLDARYRPHIIDFLR